MNSLKFDRIVTHRLENCRSVLSTKNEEYSSSTDRLHNFKVAGRIRGVSPEQALDGMWVKHLVSVWDAIDRMEADPIYVPSAEWVAEKLGDTINYVLLLEGLIEERRDRITDPDRQP